MSVVIGLTGGIASGKSTVARMFAERGATVIDADAIVHELQTPGAPLTQEIARAFGPAVIDAHGALDRAALAELVFRDESARRRLNAIVHPLVEEEIARRQREAIARDVPLVVVDIPLLLEGERPRREGERSGFRATVVVWVPEEVQLARQISRDGCSREEALRRIRSQMPLDRKRALADHVIDNSGSLAETERQVRDLISELREAAA